MGNTNPDHTRKTALPKMSGTVELDVRWHLREAGGDGAACVAVGAQGIPDLEKAIDERFAFFNGDICQSVPQHWCKRPDGKRCRDAHHAARTAMRRAPQTMFVCSLRKQRCAISTYNINMLVRSSLSVTVSIALPHPVQEGCHVALQPDLGYWHAPVQSGQVD